MTENDLAHHEEERFVLRRTRIVQNGQHIKEYYRACISSKVTITPYFSKAAKYETKENAESVNANYPDIGFEIIPIKVQYREES